MALIFKLAGFDCATEALAILYDIPRDKVRQVKRIAGIADRPGIFADWPLSREQAQEITDVIGAEFVVGNFDWALEPYPVPNPAKSE